MTFGSQVDLEGPARLTRALVDFESAFSQDYVIQVASPIQREREFFIDNLLVRIHFIIVMIRWTGLAPWEFEFPFPGSLTSTFLCPIHLLFFFITLKPRVE